MVPESACLKVVDQFSTCTATWGLAQQGEKVETPLGLLLVSLAFLHLPDCAEPQPLRGLLQPVVSTKVSHMSTVHSLKDRQISSCIKSNRS